MPPQKTDQTDGESLPEYKSKRPGYLKTLKGRHTKERGSNYGDRPKVQRRKSLRRGDSLLATPRALKIGASNLYKSSSTMTKGYGGLLNMGATCYANAVIQALRHCDKLSWIFSESGHETLFKREPSPFRDKQQACVKSLANVINLLNTAEERQVVRPADLWQKIHHVIENTGYDHFKRKAPHDAHEFYTFLVDTIHESTSVPVEMRVLAEEGTMQFNALSLWKRTFESQYSPFVDQFYGLYHTRVTCSKCGNISHNWEPFTSLKASVPTNVSEPPTLMSMLEAEFKPETIEDYSCDKCAPERTTATRTTSLWRLPQYLAVVLKRFTMTGQKIHTKMAPMPLTQLSFEPLFSTESPERIGKTDYSLFSVIDHHGGAGGGHYTTQACNKDDSTWHVYDDDSVIGTAGPMYGESTYVLMFQRRTVTL
jgi:ubiquitin carboxyl-terminal hydrolase 8